VELAAFLGGLSRISQRQARRQRRPSQISNGEQESHIPAHWRTCGVPSRRRGSSLLQKMEVVPVSDCTDEAVEGLAAAARQRLEFKLPWRWCAFQKPLRSDQRAGRPLTANPRSGDDKKEEAPLRAKSRRLSNHWRPRDGVPGAAKGRDCGDHFCSAAFKSQYSRQNWR
jgi:hypothetical protein